MIVFELTMPNCGSWNGRWTGEGKSYIRTRPDKSVPKEVVGKTFYHTWDDGWTACVSVTHTDRRTAEKLRKKSVGFYGYDWMIDSIISRGSIKIEGEQK